MPLEDGGGARAGAQFLLILLVIPLQYFLTRNTDESQRQQDLSTFLVWARNWTSSLSAIRTWCGDLLFFALRSRQGGNRMKMPAAVNNPPAPKETTPPPEVSRGLDAAGNFASSLEPRAPRPTHIQFRVGQVLRHKKWGYRGVIVGWDETARAPQHWLDQMHPKDKPEWRTMPNYAVLVDTRDRLTPQMAYVVEENIEVVTDTRVFHPLVDHYFEKYDKGRYSSRPWHQKVYPVD